MTPPPRCWRAKADVYRSSNRTTTLAHLQVAAVLIGGKSRVARIERYLARIFDRASGTAARYDRSARTHDNGASHAAYSKAEDTPRTISSFPVLDSAPPERRAAHIDLTGLALVPRADPAPGPGTDSQLLRDRVCRRLGSSLERVRPLAAIDSEPSVTISRLWIAGGDCDCSRATIPGASLLELSGALAEPARSLVASPDPFYHLIHVRFRRRIESQSAEMCCWTPPSG